MFDSGSAEKILVEDLLSNPSFPKPRKAI